MALASLRRMLPYSICSETVEALSLTRFDPEAGCFYAAAWDVDHVAG